MRAMTRFLVLALLLVGCRAQTTFSRTLPDDGVFESRAAPSNDQRRFRLAADYSRDHGGLSLLVVQGSDVVFEEQQNGNDAATPHHLFSGTKSFSCALATVLAADGQLDLDAPASDVLTAWKADERRRITVRELLNFTSGLEGSFRVFTRDGLLARPRIADKYARAVGLPLEHAPGSTYEYGSQHLMAFGAWVKAKTGRDPEAILEERVFTPIGMRTAGWIHDPAGNAALPYGAWTTAREWAKFGVLVRDRGVWKGRQVLDANRLAECFEGSTALPAYGLTWWLNKPIPPEKLAVADTPIKQTDGTGGPPFYTGAPPDLVVAAGYADQRLYVMPSLGLVVVRLGTGDRKWSDAAFLARLLDGIERK